MRKLASRKDSRIIDLLIEYGPEGYGTYALLVEYLKERRSFRSINDIRRIAFEIHANEEILRAVIEDFGLFEIVDGTISNKAVERKMTATEPENSDQPALPADCGRPDSMPEEIPKPTVAITETEPRTSSAKRRARRKRLRDHLKVG